MVFHKDSTTLESLVTLHPAIYLLLATVISLDILNPLLLTRGFMLILTLLSIPLIYVISRNLYGRIACEITLILSVFINIFWYYTVIVTGLYANFLGLMLALYLVYLIVKYLKCNSKVFLALALLVTPVMILSHETTLALLLALLVASIYDFAIRRDCKLLRIILTLLVPIAFTAITIPVGIKFILDFILNYVLKLKKLALKLILITPVEPVYNILKEFSPLLASVYALTGFLGLTITVMCLAYGLIMLFRRVNGLLLTPWFWIIILLLVSYFTLEYWRLALNTLTLVTVFSSTTIKSIVSKVAKTLLSARIPLKLRIALKYELLVFAVILLITLSNTTLTLLHDYNMILVEHEHQYGILEAMEWLKQNTGDNTRVLSVARWEFRYLPYITGVNFLGDYPPLTPRELKELVLHSIPEGDVVYVVVWNKLHNATVYYVNLYRESREFKELWSNSVVSIFMYIGKQYDDR